MAADWIKMRGNLWDDPRVGRLVDMTESSEAAIVGALYWLWATADQHTENGVMPGLSLARIDRKTGVPGFAAAMCAIGWLADNPEGVRIVNFEDHNGASAKRRSEDAKRKSGVRKVSADSRTNDGIVAEESGGSAELEKEKDSVPSGTDGDAVQAELTKAELWTAGKSLLESQGMPVKQCGSFVGKLVRDYGEMIVVDAVRASVVQRPADAAEYLLATCKRATGQRKPAEPEWRVEQRERTKQAAPGVASDKPASQFFIDVEAKNVITPRLA